MTIIIIQLCIIYISIGLLTVLLDYLIAIRTNPHSCMLYPYNTPVVLAGTILFPVFWTWALIDYCKKFFIKFVEFNTRLGK